MPVHLSGFNLNITDFLRKQPFHYSPITGACTSPSILHPMQLLIYFVLSNVYVLKYLQTILLGNRHHSSLRKMTYGVWSKGFCLFVYLFLNSFIEI